MVNIIMRQPCYIKHVNRLTIVSKLFDYNPQAY